MKITRATIERLIKEELRKTLLLEYEEGARVFRSPKEFTVFQNVELTKQKTQAKPAGLWYSCGAAWDEWCEYGMPEWITGAPHVYSLEINPSNMLVINTGEELMAFNEEYGKDFHSMSFIDWAAVAQQYDGIEICPYQWKYRTDLSWYYAWDVASGCIWGERAFKSVEKIKDPCRSEQE